MSEGASQAFELEAQHRWALGRRFEAHLFASSACHMVTVLLLLLMVFSISFNRVLSFQIGSGCFGRYHRYMLHWTGLTPVLPTMSKRGSQPSQMDSDTGFARLDSIIGNCKVVDFFDVSRHAAVNEQVCNYPILRKCHISQNLK